MHVTFGLEPFQISVNGCMLETKWRVTMDAMRAWISHARSFQMANMVATTEANPIFPHSNVSQVWRFAIFARANVQVCVLMAPALKTHVEKRIAVNHQATMLSAQIHAASCTWHHRFLATSWVLAQFRLKRRWNKWPECVFVRLDKFTSYELFEFCLMFMCETRPSWDIVQRHWSRLALETVNQKHQ